MRCELRSMKYKSVDVLEQYPELNDYSPEIEQTDSRSQKILTIDVDNAGEIQELLGLTVILDIDHETGERTITVCDKGE